MYLKVETLEINSIKDVLNWVKIAKDNNMKKGVLYLIHDNAKDVIDPYMISYMVDDNDCPCMMYCSADVISIKGNTGRAKTDTEIEHDILPITLDDSEGMVSKDFVLELIKVIKG